jgi:hypothetical protein
MAAKRGYTPNVAQIVLPHDGETHDRVFNVSYESAFRGMGYAVEVVPNQGRGAARQGSSPAGEYSRRAGSMNQKQEAELKLSVGITRSATKLEELALGLSMIGLRMVRTLSD